MTFAIYSPGLNERIGGSIALSKLKSNLELCGETARLCYTGDQVNGDIVVYPETVKGNPLQAKHVVRWFLSTPGEFYEDKSPSFEHDDLIFTYTSHYGRRRYYDGLLTAYDWKLDFWKDEGSQRRGTCFVRRKGYAKPFDQHRPDALCLDGYKDNETLRDAFNRHECFVSYDDQTMLSLQAALCGCLSIVIPGELSSTEWRERFPYFQFGIAYGFDEAMYARATVHHIREHLESLERLSLEQTKDFINKVRAWQ